MTRPSDQPAAIGAAQRPVDPTAVTCDHHDPSWSHENVWDRYAQLRERCPVSRGEKYGGYWVLSRYDDVKAATEDHETYSSAQGMFLPNYSTIRIPPIEFDPPEHTWMRRVIAPMVNAAVAKPGCTVLMC